MLKIELDSKTYDILEGSTLNEIFNNNKENFSTLGYKLNSQIILLNTPILTNGKITRLKITDSDGIRIYKNSIIFLVIAVCKKLFPNRHVVINHTISGGIYCTFSNDVFSHEIVKTIAIEVQKQIDKNLPFEQMTMSAQEASKYFENIGWIETANHIMSIKTSTVTLTSVDGQLGFAFGTLVPTTGYLTKYELLSYADGIIIRYPNQSSNGNIPKFIEQPKLFGVFREYERWQTILSLRNVSDLNLRVQNKSITEVIHVAESLHEKKIAFIADDIAKNSDLLRIILIAGPSSSGKTTFSKRLAVHLKVNGINTYPISLDNYFKDRILTPRDENGEYDFESLYALNLELFNKQLTQILAGELVELPKYDFSRGKSIISDNKIKIDSKTILIIEGIHGLNDELTSSIFDILKYKIYISAFTPIGLDNTNRLPTTDLRLMRRIVRDNFYRGYSALDTLKRWPLVRHGEKQWIFPHQNKANIMFNSTLIYEPAVLKSYAQPLLEKITIDEPVYEEAKRLCDFLSLFEPLDPTPIPGTSIIREFIGDSHFNY